MAQVDAVHQNRVFLNSTDDSAASVVWGGPIPTDGNGTAVDPNATWLEGNAPGTANVLATGTTIGTIIGTTIGTGTGIGTGTVTGTPRLIDVHSIVYTDSTTGTRQIRGMTTAEVAQEISNAMERQFSDWDGAYDPTTNENPQTAAKLETAATAPTATRRRRTRS